MKWIEFIKVQTPGNQNQFLNQEMLKITCSLANKVGLIDVCFSHHSSLLGDFALFLFWESDYKDASGSRTGLNVKRVLNKYGLVNHSVWLINV